MPSGGLAWYRYFQKITHILVFNGVRVPSGDGLGVVILAMEDNERSHGKQRPDALPGIRSVDRMGPSRIYDHSISFFFQTPGGRNS